MMSESDFFRKGEDSFRGICPAFMCHKCGEERRRQRKNTSRQISTEIIRNEVSSRVFETQRLNSVRTSRSFSWASRILEQDVWIIGWIEFWYRILYKNTKSPKRFGVSRRTWAVLKISAVLSAKLPAWFSFLVNFGQFCGRFQFLAFFKKRYRSRRVACSVILGLENKKKVEKFTRCYCGSPVQQGP